MTESEKATLPELLAALTGQGIYDISLVENELSRYGFCYTRADDRLQFGPMSTVLGSVSPEVAAADDTATMDLQWAGGRVVDAIVLSRAILRLVAPGHIVPLAETYDRVRQYRTDVAMIATLWKA